MRGGQRAKQHMRNGSFGARSLTRPLDAAAAPDPPFALLTLYIIAILAGQNSIDWLQICPIDVKNSIDGCKNARIRRFFLQIQVSKWRVNFFIGFSYEVIIFPAICGMWEENPAMMMPMDEK